MDKNELIKILKDDYKLLYQYDEKPVYLIENINGDKFIAKCVDEHHFDEEKFQMWEKIDHPNITRIVDRINYIDQVIYIMSYLKGMTLFDYVNEEGPMNESQAKLILSQLVDIFSYLHEFEGGLIYRDIHPKNILLHEDKAYLIDLDSTRIYKKNADFDTIAIGVIGFIAPEQYGFEQSSVQSDIYGLGVLISFLLTGKHPNFQQNKVFLDNLLISKDFKKLLIQMTAFNKKDRPQTMAVIRRRLEDRTLKLISKTSLMASILILLSLSMSVYLYSKSIKPEKVIESNEENMENKSSLEEDVINPTYSETHQVLSFKETMDSYLIFNKTYESSVDNSVSLKALTEELLDDSKEIDKTYESDSSESTEENEKVVENEPDVSSSEEIDESEVATSEINEVNGETDEVVESEDSVLEEKYNIRSDETSQEIKNPLLIKPNIDENDYLILDRSMNFNTITESGVEDNNYSTLELRFENISRIEEYDLKDSDYIIHDIRVASDNQFVYIDIVYDSPQTYDYLLIYEPLNLYGLKHYVKKENVIKLGVNSIYIKLKRERVSQLDSVLAIDIGDDYPLLIDSKKIHDAIDRADKYALLTGDAYGANLIKKSYACENFPQLYDATIVSSFSADWEDIHFFKETLFEDVEDITVSIYKDLDYIYLNLNYESKSPGGTVASFRVENQSGVFAKFSNHVVIGQNDYVLKINRKQFEDIVENNAMRILGFGLDLREGSRAIIKISIEDILN